MSTGRLRVIDSARSPAGERRPAAPPARPSRPRTRSSEATRRVFAAFAPVALLLLLPVLVALPARAAAPPPVVLQAAGPGAEDAARRCQDAWTRRGPDLVARLVPAGARLDTVRVLLVPSSMFQRRFGRSIPDWGVGVALRPGHLVAIDYTRLPAVGRGVDEVFLHEMVHALLMQATGDAWLPTWLHEGSAMWLSGEWRFTDTVAVILAGHVPSLTRLRAPFPRGAAGADMAYRTSLLAVGRLRSWYGDDVLGRLVAVTAAEGDFTSAFLTVTGDELEAFEKRFAGAMQLRYGWVVLAFRWPTLFVLMALVFAVGAIRRIVRSRRRLAQMDDAEIDDVET
jgi:hypothetical protein